MKRFWLNKYKSKVAKRENNGAISENVRKVGEFVKGLFGKYENIPYDENSVMIEKTGNFSKITKHYY